ncbi:MAG: CoA-binding protein [Acidobacteria bacterium]|nr:CoA-binding protein [Acidobacteriota bacterium]
MSDLSCRLPQFDPLQSGDEESRLRDILLAAKTIAVVGLSSDERRASHGVAEYMQSQGYRIIPVNPNERAVLGEKSYATLEAIPFPIGIVDIFRRSEFVAPFVDAAIALRAKAIWMQESVVDEASAQRARAAGLAVAMDRCILKDHMRWKREKIALSR